jgi:hypothetical protein
MTKIPNANFYRLMAVLSAPFWYMMPRNHQTKNAFPMLFKMLSNARLRITNASLSRPSPVYLAFSASSRSWPRTHGRVTDHSTFGT